MNEFVQLFDQIVNQITISDDVRGRFGELDNYDNTVERIVNSTFLNSSIIFNVTEVFNLTSEAEVDGGHLNLWWALLASLLVLFTAIGNVLVCLAICLERRLQNVTNYFLMSLAITDLLVAMLVMPLGIVTLVQGRFPFAATYCLLWVCLDVLLCTASIMHLCTISVDRYLSLRYPMRFGRNKTRKRVVVKIALVWILSVCMSLPLSLMYSQNEESVLIGGACQIPDPLYKAIGSIISFYIPLGVMLLTYCLTVQLLARQRKGLGNGWAAGWLERRCTWRRFLGRGGTPQHSAASTETELPPIDTRDLWLQDSRMNVSERGGMLTPGSLSVSSSSPSSMLQDRRRPSSTIDPHTPVHMQRPRSASDDETQNDGLLAPTTLTVKSRSSEDGLLLPPPCTCPYFGTESTPPRRTTEVIIVPGGDINNCNGFSKNGNYKTEETPTSTPFSRRSSRGTASMVTWEESRRFRRGSSFGGARTTLSTPVRSVRTRRSVNARQQVTASPQRQPPRTHHSRNSSVISRNSSRHGRILRLEQKATKVLGVVFFTFVVLWAPFFILNMLPVICAECEKSIPVWVFDFVLWLGYASSMVNPIFYTIFNKSFRQAFKKVLKCEYFRARR